MITCPFCQTANIPNTVFCGGCGFLLLDQDTIDTKRMDTGDKPDPVTEAANRSEFTSPRQSGTRPLTLRLTIDAMGRDIELALDKVIYIGRTDLANNLMSDVDLSDCGDQAATISRRHARIMADEHSVVIEDLNSTNGTYINRIQLAPFSPQVLLSGDLLQVGSLQMQLTFVVP